MEQATQIVVDEIETLERRIRAFSQFAAEPPVQPGEVAPAPVTTQTTASGETSPFVTPTLSRYTEMQDLLLLDPIHDVDDSGWPRRAPETPAQ